MAIKKTTFTRLTIATGATLPASFATNIRRHITELTNVGLTQTTDTGQLIPENITSPTVSNTSIVGYIMYKVWDNVYLKCEYVFANVTSTANNAIYYIKPSVGSATDGAGNFIGNKVEFKNFGIQPGVTSYSSTETVNTSSSVINAGFITSFIYKSDITFWCAIDIDRNTNALNPTLCMMINKSCDSNLVPNDNFISVYSQEQDVANVCIGSWSVVSNKMFSPTKLVLDDTKRTVPTTIPTTLFFDDYFNIPVKKTYHNIFDGDMNTNYDMLAGTNAYSIHNQTYMYKNGGLVPRRYIMFAASSADIKPFKVSASAEPVYLIWDGD